MGLRASLDLFAVYLRPTSLRMLVLGFSAGLPFLLVFTTLTAWLRDVGISRSAIGFFAWIGLTYSIKVVWAPVVDRVSLPGLTRVLGQRRSWMVLAQLGIMGGLTAMALTDPTEGLSRIAALAILVALCSATQDIAIDAFRIESDEDRYQAALAATYVVGYRLAVLVAGAGALYLADARGWPTAYLAMAAAMVPGFMLVLLAREPSRPELLDIERDTLVAAFRERTRLRGWPRELGAWFTGSVISPLSDFLTRHRNLALPLLVLVGLYKISDLSMAAMANPLYIDLGFSLSEIASVTKVFGVAMTLLGGLISGSLVARFGVYPALLLGAVLVAVTNLVFAWLALVQGGLAALFVAVGADNLANGFSATAFIAFLSSLVSRRHTATQYALLSSIMTLPGKLIGGPSGAIVDSVGYPVFFVYASLLGIPAVLLTLWLMRHLPGSSDIDRGPDTDTGNDPDLGTGADTDTGAGADDGNAPPKEVPAVGRGASS